MTMYTESLRAFLKPVLPYLDDESVTEIMINGPEDVWIERKGRLSKTEARFSEEGLLGAARNMAQFVGRPLSDERPRLDARLPDGSRIHVVLPPIARRGTTISIRKFFKDRLGVDALLKYNSLTAPMAKLLEAIIRVKANAIVSGGTGSGKTTLLNIISSLIPNDERILTIEDSAELQLNQEHLVTFESRPPDKYGKGAVDMGDLLHSALRLRPDRIVVGEVRGGECFHLMQAMNTGHGGSLSTCHANTPIDTLRRLESLCLMSAVEMPLVAVRAQVASAINVIICCERLHDGSRKLTHLSEVLPLNDKGDYRTQDIFVFTPVTRDEDGNVLGYHAPTGLLPTFLPKAHAHGFTEFDERFFDPATYGVPPPPQYAMGESYQARWVSALAHRAQGLPDPDSYREQWRSLEERLKSEARAKRTSAPSARTPAAGAKASAPPAPMRPAPRAGAVTTLGEQTGGYDEDKTPVPRLPPPTERGFNRKPTDTDLKPVSGANLDDNVELADDLAAAAEHIPPPPPRTGPPARAGQPASASRFQAPAPGRPKPR